MHFKMEFANETVMREISTIAIQHHLECVEEGGFAVKIIFHDITDVNMYANPLVVLKNDGLWSIGHAVLDPQPTSAAELVKKVVDTMRQKPQPRQLTQFDAQFL